MCVCIVVTFSIKRRGNVYAFESDPRTGCTRLLCSLSFGLFSSFSFSLARFLSHSLIRSDIATQLTTTLGALINTAFVHQARFADATSVKYDPAALAISRKLNHGLIMMALCVHYTSDMDAGTTPRARHECKL
jgi:hypothetical protein